MIMSNLSAGRAPAAAVACVLTWSLSLAVAPASAQSKSAAAAKALATALDAAKLDAIAAADPGQPGTFVAALYIQGGQLMVVSAKYAAPPLLLDKMKTKNYRDIYIDLNSASVAGTKVFCIDQGIDGLVAKPDNDQAPDTWENGTKQLALDGDWRKAKMSEQDYMKAFSDADERYVQILTLLIAEAKQGT
jgi:hypothetical protein